jgi:hypothetical protein
MLDLEAIQSREIVGAWAEQLRMISSRWADLPPREEQSGQALAKRLEAIGDVCTMAKSEQLAEVISFAKERERRRSLGRGLELGRPHGLGGLRLTPQDDDLDAEDLPDDGPPPLTANLRPAEEVDLGDLDAIVRARRDAGMLAEEGGAA